MSTTQPIKDKEKLEAFKQYYLLKKPHLRNYAMIVFSLNTALRISDILSLHWQDIYDPQMQRIGAHLEIREKKTGKHIVLAINEGTEAILQNYHAYVFSHRPYDPCRYLFTSRKGKNQPLSRSQAFRIIKEAASASGLLTHISCHSMRKTFGYHAWQQGIPPVLLMDIYNHSSYHITKRYLCIEQEERDAVYRKITL